MDKYMKNRKVNLLIIGKCPLPVGGVTVHVKRLLDWLDYEDIPYSYYDLKHFNVLSFYFAIRNSQYAHLHSSSPLLHFLFSLICLFSRTKSLITFHGNIGRFGIWRNFLEMLSIKFSTIPIVLNEDSYVKVKPYNKRILLLSAYIPQVIEEKLDNEILHRIHKLQNKYKFILCTNAFNINYDNQGNDIYGIFDLVAFFSNRSDICLIISDTSGNYHRHINYKNDNIYFIDKPHPFINVLSLSDCFIRYTSTDGDSLSIHEAIDIGIPVIATNVVSRPYGVCLVQRGNIKELNETIDNVMKNKEFYSCRKFDSIKLEPDIIKVYKKFFNIK